MKNKIISLQEHEKQYYKKRKNIFFFLLISIFVFLFEYPQQVCNSTHQLVEIQDSIDKWSEHWYKYYNLNELTNPRTGYKIKSYHIKAGMNGIGYWETKMKPGNITEEPTVSGKSYGWPCILSTTAKCMGWKGKNPLELLNPDEAGEYATKFLCMNIKKYDGHMYKAFAAFNAGKFRPGKKLFARNQYYVDNIVPIYHYYVRHYIKEDRKTTKVEK